MEGHHEVRKTLSLWHLSKKRVVSLVNTLRPKCFFSARGKNGPWWTIRVGGKVWITSDEKKGGVVSCGPFPIPWLGRNSRYPRWFQTYNIFRIFSVCVETPFWIEYRISRHALRQWQISRLCMVARKPESSWALAASWTEKLWVGSGGPGVIP